MELHVNIYGTIDFDKEGEQFEIDSDDLIWTKDGRRFRARFALYDLVELEPETLENE